MVSKMKDKKILTLKEYIKKMTVAFVSYFLLYFFSFPGP